MGVRLDLLRLLNDEELMGLARRDPGYPFGRTAEGMPVATPTGRRSGRRSAEVAGHLRAWNRRARSGAVFG